MRLLLVAPFLLSTASAAVEATWGLDVLNRIVADPANVAIPVTQARLSGFTEDLVTEYRKPSVTLKAGERGSITATVTASGTYYPAFIFYDSAGDERIGISVAGVSRGIAVANADDNRQRLYFLSEPVTFRGGETIVLETQTPNGIYRTEDLFLLRARPASKLHTYEIREVHAEPSVTGATVTWITNWLAQCAIETGDGRRIAETSAENNHRLALSGLDPRREYRFRITAKSREGKDVASEWQTFRTEVRPAPAGSVRKASLPLTLEPGGPADFPITAGIPFPKGTLATDAHIRLLDASARELPLSTEVLGRWDDGSVKWVLLDFQGAGRTLEYGSEIRRKPVPAPLQVTDTAAGISVATGPLAFTVSKRRFGLLESVWLGKTRVTPADRPSAFYLTGPDGTVYDTLAPPDEVVVERRDPLRVVIRATGEHRGPGGRKLFAYTVRFHAYAGKPFIRVQHTFGNNSAAGEFTSIRSLTLRLPLEGGAASPARNVKQRTDEHPRIPDWVEWKGHDRTVTLAVRNLWQNYPKDVSVGPEGIDLALCPELKTDEYSGAKGTVDEHRLYYYLQDGRYKLRQGVTKTHDIWLDFGPGPSPLQSRTTPLMAFAPPQWYVDGKAFGIIAPPKPQGLIALYDRTFERGYGAYLKSRESNREYGMLNFGDWWGERGINWGNSEYDTQHALFLQAIRTGDARLFRTGEEVEWHNRDVDVVHHHSDRTRIGGVYLHSIGHTGDYYPVSPVPNQGIPLGRMIISHTFIEGHLDYYFLTGDRRSLETARATADRYDTLETRNYDFTNCRNPGWHLILTMAMYNATNDRFYLNAGKIIMERVLERQTEDGGWRRQLVPGHCACLPRHSGNAGFMVGVLMTGMKKYYATTRDERVAASIVKASHFLISDTWTPEVGGFRYTSCPRTKASAGFLMLDGLTFAYERTRDAKLREVLLANTDAAIKNMAEFAIGKGFTQFTRVTPHFIETLATLRGE